MKVGQLTDPWMSLAVEETFHILELLHQISTGESLISRSLCEVHHPVAVDDCFLSGSNMVFDLVLLTPRRYGALSAINGCFHSILSTAYSLCDTRKF